MSKKLNRESIHHPSRSHLDFNTMRDQQKRMSKRNFGSKQREVELKQSNKEDIPQSTYKKLNFKYWRLILKALTFKFSERIISHVEGRRAKNDLKRANAYDKPRIAKELEKQASDIAKEIQESIAEKQSQYGKLEERQLQHNELLFLKQGKAISKTEHMMLGDYPLGVRSSNSKFKREFKAFLDKHTMGLSKKYTNREIKKLQKNYDSQLQELRLRNYEGAQKAFKAHEYLYKAKGGVTFDAKNIRSGAKIFKFGSSKLNTVSKPLLALATTAQTADDVLGGVSVFSRGLNFALSVYDGYESIQCAKVAKKRHNIAKGYVEQYSKYHSFEESHRVSNQVKSKLGINYKNKKNPADKKELNFQERELGAIAYSIYRSNDANEHKLDATYKGVKALLSFTLAAYGVAVVTGVSSGGTVLPATMGVASTASLGMTVGYITYKVSKTVNKKRKCSAWRQVDKKLNNLTKEKDNLKGLMAGKANAFDPSLNKMDKKYKELAKKSKSQQVKSKLSYLVSDKSGYKKDKLYIPLKQQMYDKHGGSKPIKDIEKEISKQIRFIRDQPFSDHPLFTSIYLQTHKEHVDRLGEVQVLDITISKIKIAILEKSLQKNKLFHQCLKEAEEYVGTSLDSGDEVYFDFVKESARMHRIHHDQSFAIDNLYEHLISEQPEYIRGERKNLKSTPSLDFIHSLIIPQEIADDLLHAILDSNSPIVAKELLRTYMMDTNVS